MAAKVLDLTAYRKRKPVERRLRSEGKADIISFTEARVMRSIRRNGESLKGRGFPDDLNFGPDEPLIDDAMENAMMRMIFGDDYDKEDE